MMIECMSMAQYGIGFKNQASKVLKCMIMHSIVWFWYDHGTVQDGFGMIMALYDIALYDYCTVWYDYGIVQLWHGMV